MRFLSYEDTQSLRNCCLYLHNFTRELRLTWRVFPAPRDLVINRVVGLFVHWAKLDAEGVQKLHFPLKDVKLREICPRHQQLGRFQFN